MRHVAEPPSVSRWLVPVTIVLGFLVAGCGDDLRNEDTEQRHPDVIEVMVSRGSTGTLRFDVTVSSPYDGPERYADAWRVVGPDGTVHGVRELLHHHADEQPFTRSLDGVEIPDGVGFVVVEARDLVNGWGGATVEVAVPPRALP